MKTVYVAGPYSSSNVLEVFDNMRLGMNLSLQVLKLGAAPFVPWFDYHFALLQGDLSIEQFYKYSLAWLEKSDAMIVQPLRAADSKGTMNELDRARGLGIPVFYRDDSADALEELRVWLGSDALPAADTDRAESKVSVSYSKPVAEAKQEADGSVLLEAQGLVYGPREGSYGHPREDFTRTAAMWSGYLGVKIQPGDVGQMMILLKASRERNRHSRDNLTDQAGYAETCRRVHGD